MDAAVKEPKRIGRPPSRKKLLTLRLEPEIVEHFRALGGKGWLQGVNDTLKEAMNQNQRMVEEVERRAKAALKQRERRAQRKARRG